MMILVAGLPGSGKSFFANRLAAQLNAAYISSDEMRNRLNAQGKYSSQDKLIVYKKMVRWAEEYLVQNKSVVLDATFYQRAIRGLFFELAKKQKVPVCLIQVTAEEQLVRQRLDKPREESEADFSVYQQVKTEFEPIDGEYLQLQSTNDNISEMLKQALTYIRKNDGRKGDGDIE